MDNEALNYAWELFSNEGYSGSIEDFNNLISKDTEALNYSFELFSKKGYGGSVKDFSTLIGIGEPKKKVKESEDEKEDTDIHSWLDDISIDTQTGRETPVADSFFIGMEEEDVVKSLKDTYPGFEIEESWSWDPRDILGTTGVLGAGFNEDAVKITNPKNGESITIPLDLNTRLFQKGRGEESKLKLKEFIDKNIDALDKDQYELNKSNRINEAIERENNSIDEGGYGISEDQQKKINEQVQNVDLNDPAPETRTSRYTTYTFTPDNPYEKELKQAEQALLADPAKPQDYKPTRAEIDQKALQIIKDNKIRETKTSNREKWLEEHPEEQGKTLLGEIELSKEIKTTFEAEESLYEDMVDHWQGKVLNSTESSIINDFEKINNNPDAKFTINQGDTVVTLNNGKQISQNQLNRVRQSYQFMYDKSLQIEEQYKTVNDLVDKIGDIELSKDVLRRDYNLWQKSGFTIGSGFADLAVNSMYYAKAYAENAPSLFSIGKGVYGGGISGLEKLGDIKELGETVIPEQVKKLDNLVNDAFFSYKEWSGDVKESYSKDVTFDKALGLGDKDFNWDNFGIFALQEISTQIPILTTIAATGGAGTVVIGASSGGGYIMDSDYQEKVSGVKRKSAILDGDRSDLETFLIGTGFGVAEGGFEALTTLPMLKRGQALIRKQGKEALVRDVLYDYLKRETGRSVLYDPAAESISEGLTQVTQNFLDGRPISEGVDHAMFSGLMMGGVMSVSPFVAGAVTSAYYNKNNKLGLQTQELIKERDQLETSINEIDANWRLSDQMKKQWKTTSQERLTTVNKMIETNLNSLTNNVFNNIEGEAAEYFFGTQLKLEKVRTQASDIVKSIEEGKISKSNGQQQLRILKIKYDLYKQNIYDFRDAKNFGDSFNLLDENVKKEYNDRATQNIIKAKSQEGLNLTQEDISPKEIKQEADKLYVQDKINENKDRDIKLLNALDVDVIEFKTNAQAAKWYKENFKDDPSFEENLEHIKNGRINGFNPTGGKRVDGRGQIMFVEEAAINNYKTETRSHELSHTLLFDILGDSRTNPELYTQAANQIALYLSQTNKTAYNSLFGKGTYTGAVETTTDTDQPSITINGQKFLAEEVLTNFIELVGKKRVELDAKNKPKFSGLLGTMLNGLYNSVTGRNIPFKGNMDVINFVQGLGEKIADGTLTKENVREFKEQLPESLTKTDDTKVVDIKQKPVDTKIAASKKTDTKFSKKLSPEKTTAVEQSILELKQEIKENEEIAKKYGKEPIPTAKQQRLEQSILKEQLKPTIDSFVESQTKRLFDPIAPDARNNVTRQTFKESMVSDIETMILKEFEQKQDIEKFITSRGYLRANSLAERLGVESVEKGIKKDIDQAKGIAAETETVTIKDKTPTKQIKLKERLGDDAVKITEEVKERGKDIDLETVDFKTLKDLTPEMTQEMFGIVPKTGNLTKADVRNAQQFISKNADVLIAMLPEGSTPSGTSTGVQKVLLDAFYTKGDRAVMAKTGSKAGLQEQTKRDNITKEEFNELFGITPAGQLNLSDRNTSSRIKALVTQTGRMLTNQAIREQAEVKGKKVPSKVFEGKSRIMFSKVVRDFNIDDAQLFYKKLKNVNFDAKNISPESIYNKLYEEFKDDLKNSVIKNIAKDLYTYASMYKDVVEKQKNTNTKTEVTLNQFLYDQSYAAYTNTNILNYLKINGNMAQMFDNINNIIRQRQAILDFAENLIKEGKNKKEVVEMILKYGKGMYASSSKIGRGLFDVIDGVVVKEKNTDKISVPRYQSFKNVSDFINNVINKIPGVEGFNSKGQGIIDGKKVTIETKLYSETSAAAIKDRDYVGRKKQAKEAENFVKDIIQYYVKQIKDPKSSITKVDLGMLMASMASNMQSPLKRAANLAYIYKGKKMPATSLRYEHMIPTNYMVLKLLDAYLNPGNVDINALFESYTVAVIPIVMDKVLIRVGLANVMPIKFLDGDPSSFRYYNMLTFGEQNLYPIESLNPTDKGKLVGEAFVKAGNKLNIQQATQYNNKEINKSRVMYSKSFSNLETIREAEILDKALNIARDPNAPVKKIRVFDFDDTLARTKSGVKYTMPNETGKPQPGRKAILLVGSAGAGKSTLVNKLGLRKQGYKYVNQDVALDWLAKNAGLPKDMNEFTDAETSKWRDLQSEAAQAAKTKATRLQGEGSGVIIDATGSSSVGFEKTARELADAGYDAHIVFVDSSLDTALKRNKARGERKLTDTTVKNSYEAVQKNKREFSEYTGRMVMGKPLAKEFTEINTDDLKQGDPLPAEFISKINDFTSGYVKGRLTAEEFAQKGTELLEQGAEFDFSEFNKVKEGKKGPLLGVAKAIQEARGTKDVFILTARSAEAAPAIKEFLDSQGLDIPLQNITGLGDSSPLAKSGWMVDKAAEGYNDFYFADDHMANVDAVQAALEATGVKSKVQQAKIKFSLNTKRDLKWDSYKDDMGNTVNIAPFKIDGKNYEITIRNIPSNEKPGTFRNALLFGKTTGKTIQDGEKSANVLHYGYTKTGDAMKVISIVSNGLFDFVKKNNIDNLYFTAEGKSRVDLYKRLAKFWANKLGMNYTYEDGFWSHPDDVEANFTIATRELPKPKTKDFMDVTPSQPQAVKRVLNVVDVKSKVQKSKIKFSKNVDKMMNNIIYEKTGIEQYKEFSEVTAKARGRKTKSFDLIPPSAQDFGGLLYKLLAKGETGNTQWKWMQDHLIKPYGRAMNDLSVAQNQLMADFRALKESLIGIPKNLKKEAVQGFTNEDVVRVATWDRQGIKVEGISKKDLDSIRKYVEGKPDLTIFIDQLIAITKGDGYYYPGANWLAGTITTDFREGLRQVTRKNLLKQWEENVDLAFNESNMNKIEAAFGPKYREALENSLFRMKTGQNRRQGMSSIEQNFLDYLNNSVGAVMFLNARSAVLQTISAVNFLNWKDNNPAKAAAAFANQPRYWKDFMTLMNSDFLVDRRNGLKINVSESEIAEAAKTAKNTVKGVISLLLNKGFMFTQIADSFAIASGGATLYRNRIKTYMKEGMSEADATEKAFLDFRELAEESQQSARADKISQQQASTLGRLVLAFANTPSQYARIMDKAGKDLIAGRGDWKANMSKIAYYGVIQNLLFTALQSALFAYGMDDQEEEETRIFPEDKMLDTANSMADNLLRGIGVAGVILAQSKNMIIDLVKRSQKDPYFNPDAKAFPGPNYEDAVEKLLAISPPISIKYRKIKGGITDWYFNRWRPEASEPFNINNPSYRAASKVIAGVTNVPLDRLFQKIENIQGAMDDTNQTWQRVFMLLGWPKWQLETPKEKEKRKAKEKEERRNIRAEDKPSIYTKDEQVNILKQYELSDEEIKELKNEELRVNKIEQLRDSTKVTHTPQAIKSKPKPKVEKKDSTSYKPSSKVKTTSTSIPKKKSTRKKILLEDRTKRQARLYKLKKSDQLDTLKSLGLSGSMLDALKYEEDRVRKIEELYDKNK